jgi:hypothetical protein
MLHFIFSGTSPSKTHPYSVFSVQIAAPRTPESVFRHVLVFNEKNGSFT